MHHRSFRQPVDREHHIAFPVHRLAIVPANYLISFLIGLATVFTLSAQTPAAISPGSLWPDKAGNHIQAHGGGIVRLGNTWYWYGEERRKGLDSAKRYVSCYSSSDLLHWKFLGDAFETGELDSLGAGWILERPKVFYNKTTRRFVMYFHLDNKSYKYARVGIAVSKRPAGPFIYVKSFRPLDQESRDIGQFIDDDGAAYLVFEDRPNGFHIARLSPDYMSLDKEMCLIKEHMEGGAIVHYKGLYYAIGSALTGWRANPNKFATATSLEGPWSAFTDIAPPATNTYGSQSTMLLKVAGTKDTAVIFMGDIWKPKTQWESAYLWMPATIGEGKLAVPQPRNWTIDVTTGKWEYAGRFVHPGILHSMASLDHIYEVAQKKIIPEYGSYELLRDHPLASADYKMNGPFAIISRDGPYAYTKSKMEADFSAAYLNALMWVATKDPAHAKKSLDILSAYADSLTTIPSTNDAPLLAGLEGIKIVNAMEILRYTYKAIPNGQTEKINRMIRNIFLPVCEKFYDTIPYTNGNWGGIVTRMYISSAIYFDNEGMYKKAVDFYLNGSDNGTILHYNNDSTGQIQESGRDQGHSQLGIGALATVCEIAWNQHDDLYSALGNRLLKGFEYVAKYNLGHDDMPFITWKDITGKYSTWTQISSISRGRFIPVYEMVYNHYVSRKGLSMPYTAEVIKKIRPEGYDRDQPAFGTLLFYGTGK
jgi:hypothetical protein